jgi:hypothetical protein
MSEVAKWGPLSKSAIQPAVADLQIEGGGTRRLTVHPGEAEPLGDCDVQHEQGRTFTVVSRQPSGAAWPARMAHDLAATV